MSDSIMGEFLFTWKINNYLSYYQGTSTEIESPTFIVENLYDSEYVLKWDPLENFRCNQNYASIFLSKISKKDFQRDLQFEVDFEILDNEGCVIKCEKCNSVPAYCSKFIDNSKLDDMVMSWPDDILTIRCRIKSTKVKIQSMYEVNACTTIDTDRRCAELDMTIPKLYKYSECINIPTLHHMEVIVSYLLNVFTISIRSNETESGQFVGGKFIMKISFCDRNGYELISKRSAKYISKNDIWTFPDFITSELLQVCHNGDSYYEFKLKFQLDKPKHSISKNCFENVKLKSLFSEDLEHKKAAMSPMAIEFHSLYNSKKYTDVTLRVEGEELPVHKFILKVRSPVFAVMFDSDFLEHQTGVVDIDDLDGNTLKAFLKFLYTETVDNLEYEMAKKLILAADKYQVPSLVDKCSFFLRSILSMENVYDIVALADTVNCKSLEHHALIFIKVNAAEILSSTQWSQWMEGNTKLAMNILSKLSVELAKAKFK